MAIVKELADSAQCPYGFSSFSRVLNWVFNFRNFSLSFFNFALIRSQPLPHYCSQDNIKSVEFEYLRMVMDRLDVVCDDADNVQESLLEEPRLEELKQAFDVYDENRDGFIDAEELQRVLCGLGLEEGSEIEECKQMIKLADQNGDGVIDFNEFVNFMVSKLS